MECALNDRPAGGWVFPTRTLEDHGSAVLVASVTPTEASALLCEWERAPCPSPVKRKHTRCPGKRTALLLRLSSFYAPPPAPTLTVCIIASSFYNFGCFIFVFCVFCFGLVFWWLFIYLVVVVVVSWGL